MKYNSVVLFCVIALASACVSIFPGNTSGSGVEESYSEDLSTLRPAFEAPESPAIDSLDTENTTVSDSASFYALVNDTVNIILDSIASQKLAANKVSGYTILVYSSMSREEARKAIGRVYKIAPEAKADLQFQQPFFRVKAGHFLHEYHAYKLLNSIKEEFPTAILIPETYKITEPDDK